MLKLLRMKKNHLSLVGLLVSGIMFFSFFIACNNTEEISTATPADTEDSVKKMVDRGRYLANYVSLCIDCHSQRDFNQFSGPLVPGTEGMGGEVFNEKLGIPGVLYAKNITPDTANGIGNWSDDEVARAITRGIAKDGDTLFPLMPY